MLKRIIFSAVAGIFVLIVFAYFKNIIFSAVAGIYMLMVIKYLATLVGNHIHNRATSGISSYSMTNNEMKIYLNKLGIYLSELGLCSLLFSGFYSLSIMGYLLLSGPNGFFTALIVLTIFGALLSLTYYLYFSYIQPVTTVEIEPRQRILGIVKSVLLGFFLYIVGLILSAEFFSRIEV